MTWRKREITDMAREAGDATTDARGRETFVFDCYGLEAFSKLVREDERERIKQANAPEIDRINAYIKQLEDAIRARGQA